MTLLSPLALLGLLTLPIVVLFYLFRPEPRRRQSTTYFLWKAAAPDSQGGTFAKRLQQNPLLWIQLLILILLVIFLARPSLPWQSSAPKGNRVILVIDRSASMNAETVFPTAKEKALDAVDEMLGFKLSGSTPEVMLIAVDAAPQVLVPFTKDRGQLVDAIDALTVSDVPDELGGLRPFFLSLVKAHKARLWLFSDHLPETLKLAGLQYTACAQEEHHNVGIVSFSVRQPDESRGQKKPFVYSRIENFSETAQQRTVRLEKLQSDDLDAVEALVMEDNILLPVGGGHTISESIPASRLEALENSVFRLTISSPTGEAEEAFQTDNEAFCVVPPFLSDKVLVAQAPGLKAPFLLRAIAAASGIKVFPVKDLLRLPDPPVVDLLLAPNSFPIPSSLKVRSRFVVAPPPSDKDIPLGKLTIAQQNAPLVADSGVEWNRLKVRLTDTTPVSETETVLLKTPQGPALSLSGAASGLPTLHWRFPLAYSSLPLSPALPIVVGRFINEYSRSSGVPVNGSVTTSNGMRRPSGQAWKGPLRIDGLAGRASELEKPGEVAADSEFLPARPLTGIYTVLASESGHSEPLAVNLFSVSESKLPLDLEDQNFALDGELPETGIERTTQETQYRSIALPFLFLALVFLFFEAFVFLRRGRP